MSDVAVNENFVNSQLESFLARSDYEEPAEQEAPQEEVKAVETAEPEENLEKQALETETTDDKEEDIDESDPPEIKAKNYQAAMRAERAKRQEERARREATERELNETRSRLGKYEETIQEIIKRQSNSQQNYQQPQKATVTYEEDPIGYLKNTIEQLQSHLHHQTSYLQTQQQTAQQQQQVQRLVDDYRSKAQEFVKDAPDFMQAYDYLRNARTQQYLAAGYNLQQASQLLTEDELAIAAKAFTDGVNPAARVYEVAKTLGYNKKVEPVQPTKSLESVQKGLSSSKSLSTASGKVSPNTSSLEKLVEIADTLSGKEFDDLWNKIEAENSRFKY